VEENILPRYHLSELYSIRTNFNVCGSTLKEKDIGSVLWSWGFADGDLQLEIIFSSTNIPETIPYLYHS